MNSSGVFTNPSGHVVLPNDATTGTIADSVTKLTTASPAAVIRASAIDTNGFIGITTSGNGTTGSANVALWGLVTCQFDGATTSSDYVQNSPSQEGKCHDAGSSLPGSGQVLGRVLSTNGAQGNYNMILFPAGGTG